MDGFHPVLYFTQQCPMHPLNLVVTNFSTRQQTDSTRPRVDSGRGRLMCTCSGMKSGPTLLCNVIFT
jgi:hypothetical protein